MSIFDGLNNDDLSATTTDPRRLFRALSKPANSPFQFPYDIQAEVWDQWHSRRSERDLILKMNTGSGKTVVGLLLLKSSLNEGLGPAVYLVPNLQLESQAKLTATQLGIPWTDDPRDADFRRSDAVLIRTVQTVFNGSSKFHIRGSGRAPLPVGTIVIDDAHACIPIIEEQFSLRIPRSSDAYRGLFDLFSDSLLAQSLGGHAELVEGDGSEAVAVPYWDWSHQLNPAYGIINKGIDSKSAKFIWPLLKDNLKLCSAAFTSSEVEICLPYPDVSILPSFTDASRRIYMTATLADDSILRTHMGVDEQCVTRPITPGSASDIGDRLILTPVEMSGRITREEVQLSLVTFARDRNVVVIVPSDRRAEDWRAHTDEIHDKATVEDVIGRLREGHVGLVVLIARYDGVDLPNDACRILVLDGLPEKNSPCEQIELVATLNGGALDTQQVQRIEQGMGRGVRSADDYCAVVLLDPRLVERLYTAAAQLKLSPATRAQYALSTKFASGGKNGTVESFFVPAIEAFLSRHPDWVRASKKELESVTYDTLEKVPTTANSRRSAFEHALAGRFREAAQDLAPAINEVKNARESGWLKQEAACYLHEIDEVQARRMQHSARLKNSRILKLPEAVAYEKLSPLASQSKACVSFLTSEYSSPEAMSLAVESMLRDLMPDRTHGSHARFEAAMETLGRLLGFSSSRPDKEQNVGPDNLWDIGRDRFLVIEAKSESRASEVSRSYLSDLSAHSDWFEAEYSDPRYSYVPILVHPSRQPMWDATPRQNARVLTFEKLEQLSEALRGFRTALLASGGFDSPEEVRLRLDAYGLGASQFVEKWTTTFLSPKRKRKS